MVQVRNGDVVRDTIAGFTVQVRNGDVVRDTITGFTGVVVSRTEYLNGCVRCGVTAQELHDGKPVPTEYFDAQQLIVGHSDVQQTVTGEPTGGPGEHPPALESPPG